MKNLFLLILFALISLTATAQEEAIFSHYTINPVLVNPAAAGFDKENHNIFLNLRANWTGFPGAPTTYSINYNGPIGKNLGIGALLYSENIGALTRYRGQLSYAIHFDANDYKFGAGLSTEIHRTRIDRESFSNPELFSQNDQILNAYADGESEFDASIGAFAEYKEQVYFGVSFPNLVRSRLDKIEDLPTTFNFIANLGARFAFPSNGIKIEPSLLVKRARNTPLQTDVNLLTSFLNEQLITGLSYRLGSGGNLGLSIGSKYNAIRFLYTYEIFLDDFQSYNGGTHEISINFAIERPNEVEKNMKKKNNQ